MRRSLVIGNWKMNGSKAANEDLLRELKSGLNGVSAELGVCVPSVYLDSVNEQLQGTPVAVGAQNLSQFDSGAYTGEVSATMLADLSCRYVLVGHSERRALFGESSEIVAEKFFAAANAGLLPVLCVGETLAEREAGETLDVVAEQLNAVMDAAETLPECVVAYEPVWAIGTGLTATPGQAQDVHAFIRGKLGEQGAVTSILYGGSVKAASAAELFAQSDIDGGLVGGASLNAEEFLAISRAAQ